MEPRHNSHPRFAVMQPPNSRAPLGRSLSSSPRRSPVFVYASQSPLSITIHVDLMSKINALAATARRQISSKPISTPVNTRTGGHTRAIEWHFVYPHTLHRNTEMVIGKPDYHPLKLLLKRKWEEADRTTLWTFVYSSPKLHKKAVVRQYHSRRVKHAIIKALKERGMDRMGRPLELEEQPSGGELKPSITGTIHVFPQEKVLDLEFEDIVDDCGKLVDTILKKTGQTCSK
ncbi:hypothetical protein BT63DRAFT_455389 [Microthyrium microscopicum]|uniref:Uncharacterized protein n=1 Tax=Microthyrium microscopicum TaxID=703497 RepID=A0A6A6UDE4_9PEZI|nr:hypothetical protein BT63DRAFT_455389 [Microthyrium microscopicum]